MKRYLPIFALLTLLSGDLCKANDEYSVREFGSNIEVVTPYGSKMLFGDYGAQGKSNYRIEIPLEDIGAENPALLKALRKKRAEEEAETKKVKEEEERTKSTEESGKKKFEEQAKKLDLDVPPRVVVEYDDSDRLVLEANRLFNRGKFYESTMVIEELLRKKPGYLRGWIMKGSLMHVQGHRDLAKSAWEKAIALEPENKEVKELLSRYQ